MSNFLCIFKGLISNQFETPDTWLKIEMTKTLFYIHQSKLIREGGDMSFVLQKGGGPTFKVLSAPF